MSLHPNSSVFLQCWKTDRTGQFDWLNLEQVTCPVCSKKTIAALTRSKLTHRFNREPEKRDSCFFYLFLKKNLKSNTFPMCSLTYLTPSLSPLSLRIFRVHSSNFVNSRKTNPNFLPLLRPLPAQRRLPQPTLASPCCHRRR